ncbi:PHD finger protein At1g33420 [Linum grandiflorum]
MVMSSNRPLKRARRNRITADLHDFLTFPASESDHKSSSPAAAVGAAAGPFRDTVKAFLSNHARLTFPPSLFPSLLTWQIVFRVGDLVDGPDLSPLVVALDIVEEDVTRSPRSVYCNQCRVVGWSSHPVCRKRYHIIVRAAAAAGGSSPSEGFQKLCTKCGNSVQLSDGRCKWCDFVITSDDLEEWVYTQLEDNTHLLHGVVHSNGFGHLLRVNGKEGGSRSLTGTHIMNFWDRLCTALAVSRKVSVMDVSKKYGMEYRLLHAITKGHSWYGNWGYEFGNGSYALTSEAYRGVVETLSNVTLDHLSFHGRGPRSRLQAAIAFYKSLSPCQLVTLKDLFTFLLRLIHETNGTSNMIQNDDSGSSSSVLCVWTRKDVEEVQQSMIKVLTVAAAASSETKWVARHTLKGVMCQKASPELLNYSLSHLEGMIAPKNMVVRARCNPSSYDVEFRLEPASTSHQGLHSPYYPSKEQIKSDMKFLFDSLINPETIEKFRPSVTRQAVIDSATKLIDCKQFMKDFKPEKRLVNYSPSIYLMCHVELSDQPRDEPAIPPELLVLPSNATVASLKNEAGKAFQEVYAMCKRLQIDALLEYGSVEDSFTLKFLVGSTGTVRMRGTCSSKSAVNRYRLERGTEKWTVDCPCGAKDDDGERMLACDSCSVWQHTRCAGIENRDPTPDKFLCIRCKSSLYGRRSDSDAGTGQSSEMSSSDQMSSCRGKEAATKKMESNELTLTFSVG